MFRLIRFAFSLFVVVVVAGCAAPKAGVDPREMLRDAAFKPQSHRIPAPEEIFAVSPEMHAYVNDSEEFQTLVRHKGERGALIDALYSRPLLKLEYESSVTRNAAEAFAARSGNCLSLVIMTAAFAHELRLPVHFQTVFVDDEWTRSGDLYFVIGHVNLTLGKARRSADGTALQIDADQLVIDFVRPEALRGARLMEVDESTIIAMYYNNRAAETLEAGDVEGAYWWARAAVLQQPRFLGSFNTLAVIYRRHGDSAGAETILREVLRLEPSNVQALSNLVIAMQNQQRYAEAEQFQARLTALQPYPPFKFFDLGIEAMKRGDYLKARDLFKREVDRSAYYHEFRFWLALADYALGNVKEAGKQLSLAVENSPTRKTHDLYAAKLAWIERQEKPKEPPPLNMLPQPQMPQPVRNF